MEQKKFSYVERRWVMQAWKEVDQESAEQGSEAQGCSEMKHDLPGCRPAGTGPVFRQVKTVLGMTAIPLHSLVDFNDNFTKRESCKSRNKVRDVLTRGLKKKKFCLWSLVSQLPGDNFLLLLNILLELHNSKGCQSLRKKPKPSQSPKLPQGFFLLQFFRSGSWGLLEIENTVCYRSVVTCGWSTRRDPQHIQNSF